MVTVVDAANLLARLSLRRISCSDRGQSLGDEDDDRSLVGLLVEQIEFADVVVLNKIDIATPRDIAAARKSIIRALNADARIIETVQRRACRSTRSSTPAVQLRGRASPSAWFQELTGFKDHMPETEEYGISSFVYRARRPFEPAKLHAFFNKPWPGVVRAKGFFWLATRPDWVGELSQAGALVRNEAVGYWWAAVPKANGPRTRSCAPASTRPGMRRWGDRRQELVFIGVGDMDKAPSSRSSTPACWRCRIRRRRRQVMDIAR